MIIASMATVPGREVSAHAAVLSLLPQVHKLQLCLDGFEDFPAWVHEVWKSHRDQMDLWCFSRQGRVGDGAKFFWADRTPKNAHHLVCDDDIIYPADYAETLAEFHDQLQAPVGVHGYILEPDAERFDARSEVFHAAAPLDRVRPVHVLGTGTLCYSPGELELHFENFRWSPNVADLLFARACIEQGVPRYALPRERGWLEPVRTPTQKTIWDASVARDGSFYDAGARADGIVRATRWGALPEFRS